MAPISRVTIALSNNLADLPSNGLSWHRNGEFLKLSGDMRDITDYLSALPCDYTLIMDDSDVSFAQCSKCNEYIDSKCSTMCGNCLSWAER